MSKKILKLDFQNNFEFLVAGIISGHKDYRLCFYLNDTLKLSLKRMKDVLVPAGKPGSNTRHSHYISFGKDNESYHVISNRDKEGTGYVIPEMKNIDYFLAVVDAPGYFELDELVRRLRSIEIITGVYETDPAELKSADALLLFVEG